jgi:DNA polymerase elongation subunit (family B)
LKVLKKKNNIFIRFKHSTHEYQVIEDDDKESRCDIEIHVDWRALHPIKKDTNAPFKICSFDIECNSIDGEFPQAKREGDCIIQIGASYTKMGQSIPYRQYIACLKETSSVENTIVENNINITISDEDDDEDETSVSNLSTNDDNTNNVETNIDEIKINLSGYKFIDLSRCNSAF